MRPITRVQDPLRLNLDYGEECRIPLPNGDTLCCPAYPQDCDYVRFEDADGYEIAYWTWEEWQESPQQAMDVMGAIMGAINAAQVTGE